MKQLGPDTTVILSFDDIVKLSAKNVRFTKFLSSLPVDMRKGPMSSHPVPKAPLDPQRRMALKQSFNIIPAPSKAAIVIPSEAQEPKDPALSKTGNPSSWNTMMAPSRCSLQSSSSDDPLAAPIPSIPQSQTMRKKPYIGYIAPLPKQLKPIPPPPQPKEVRVHSQRHVVAVL